MQMTENLLEKVTMGEPLWEVHCGFAPAPTAYQFGLCQESSADVVQEALNLGARAGRGR